MKSYSSRCSSPNSSRDICCLAKNGRSGWSFPGLFLLASFISVFFSLGFSLLFSSCFIHNCQKVAPTPPEGFLFPQSRSPTRRPSWPRTKIFTKLVAVANKVSKRRPKHQAGLATSQQELWGGYQRNKISLLKPAWYG